MFENMQEKISSERKENNMNMQIYIQKMITTENMGRGYKEAIPR